MTSRSPADPAVRRARRVFLVVAVIVPVVVTAVSAGVLLTWLPSFTAPVAIHWGTNGADGFGPAATYLWLLLGIGLGLPLLMAVPTLTGLGDGWGATARLMGALAAGMSAFAAGMSLGSLALQRDLTDPAQVPGIGGVLLLAFGGLAVLGALAWFVQPRVQVAAGAPLESRRAVPVAPGERVVWVATTSLSTTAIILLGLVEASTIVLAVILLLSGSPAGWIVAIVTVVVALALAATAAFRVRITPEGLGARALLGVPKVEVALEEIVAVRAIEVSPIGDFGGWGWRWGADGRTGIVLRRGAAIEVERRGRGALVITIDGAPEAAALLQTYVDRAGGAAGNGEVAS